MQWSLNFRYNCHKNKDGNDTKKKMIISRAWRAEYLEAHRFNRYICLNRLKEELPLAIGMLAVWLAGCVVNLYTRPLSALQLWRSQICCYQEKHYWRPWIWKVSWIWESFSIAWNLMAPEEYWCYGSKLLFKNLFVLQDYYMYILES